MNLILFGCISRLMLFSGDNFLGLDKLHRDCWKHFDPTKDSERTIFFHLPLLSLYQIGILLSYSLIFSKKKISSFNLLSLAARFPFSVEFCLCMVFLLPWLIFLKIFFGFLLVNKFHSLLKGQHDDVQESAILEGYRCKNIGCDGFLLRDSGIWLF